MSRHSLNDAANGGELGVGQQLSETELQVTPFDLNRPRAETTQPTPSVSHAARRATWPNIQAEYSQPLAQESMFPSPLSTDVENPADERSEQRRRASTTTEEALESEGDGCCCPCDCLACCPATALAWIPNALHKFQGWSHAMLTIGIVAMMALFVDSVINLVNKTRTKDWSVNFNLIHDILVLLFIFPCLVYFVRAVGQYDKDHRRVKREAKRERRRLVAAYDETLAAMDGILKNTQDKNAGFAEGHFETHRYDFRRFLERVKKAATSGEVVVQEDMVTQMKKFCSIWFTVFEQCSIDPVGHPKLLIDFNALEGCITLNEVYTYCISRLELAASEVRFVSNAMAADANDIDERRAALRLKSPIGELLETEAAQEARSCIGGRTIAPWTTAITTGKGVVTRCCQIMCCYSASWISCGCGRAYVMKPHFRVDGWPKVFHFGIGCLVLLSTEHVTLLCGFCVGWMLLVMDFVTVSSAQFWPWILEPFKRNWVWPLVSWKPENSSMGIHGVLALLGVVQFCFFCTLIGFESIDILQRLVRETRRLQEARDGVQARQEQMDRFWKDVQNLTDLWLHRTIPCLDLLHEIQNHVEEMDNTDSVGCIMDLNIKLVEVFERLGPLGDWRGDGKLSISQKKRFGDSMTGAVTGMHSLTGIRGQLELCLGTVDEVLPEYATVETTISSFLRAGG